MGFQQAEITTHNSNNNRMMSTTMEVENNEWSALSYEEKNHQLFLKQKALLDGFLEHGAISKTQHDKSLHDLIEKMGENT